MSRLFTDMPTVLLTASTIMFATIFTGTTEIHNDFAQKMKPSFRGATEWLNSQPLNLKDLHGKVVLIDFWTYTCINWRRTLPYVREWASRYKDQGLVVIGVHTPEFSFEQKSENVGMAVQDMNIVYPVAVDNEYAIWNSFQNQYWPALYLIDTKGKLRYQKFGEGDYDEIERQIQKLLQEKPGNNVSISKSTVRLKGVEETPDWENLKSPENYVGYDRTQGFMSPGGVIPNNPVLYSVGGMLKLNQWGLAGQWSMGKERVLLSRGKGRIVYRFHARDLHLVMGPAVTGTSIRFRVLIDGSPPVSSYGVDIDSSGNGTITAQRMYQLVRQQGIVIEREFQIEFYNPGVEVYVFTFG